MTDEQKAIVALLASFMDLIYGTPEYELHEAPSLTIRRALKLLPLEVQRELDETGEYR